MSKGKIIPISETELVYEKIIENGDEIDDIASKIFFYKFKVIVDFTFIFGNWEGDFSVFDLFNVEC